MLFNNNNSEQNKLIILYLLLKIEIPLTRTQITNIILENNLIDYFALQECLYELEQNNLIEQINKNQIQSIYITQTGTKAIQAFLNRIPNSIIVLLDNYILENKQALKKEKEVFSSFYKKSENEYIVNLKAIENDITLINIDINVVSAKQAKLICKKWESKCEYIYSELMNSLIK